MVKASLKALLETDLNQVDSIALIINDHEGSDLFTTEIWINEVRVVNEAVESGARPAQARFLYQYWRPDAAKGEVLSRRDSPTDDRGRYYSLAIETAHRIRRQVPEMSATIILVDNNHDYDTLVMNAVSAANPDNQAAKWLESPPPDC
jgi:hypothetical protein